MGAAAEAAAPEGGGAMPGGEAWHALPVDSVPAQLASGPLGLGEAEVEARRLRYGPNALEEVPPQSALAVLLHQFRSPLIYILLVAGLVTLALGELLDTAVIALALALNAVIGFFQERRAEASVRALARLVALKARVIRGGREREIDSTELVPGDWVLLDSGKRVPADLRLVGTTELQVDESMLTGESLPVRKSAEALPADTVLADRANMAYAGTTVTSGRGRGLVVATGGESCLGVIARQVRAEQPPPTPLERRLARFARLVGLVVLASVLLAFAIGFGRGQSAHDMFLLAVGLAVAAVPEGLPVVFTVTFALGVRRMARRNAIVRRLAAVETLGSATVIGSDKTGTLTENRMTVREVWAGGHSWPVDDEPAEDGAALLADHLPLHQTLLAGVMTNEAELYRVDDRIETEGDPTEAALLRAAVRFALEPGELRGEAPSVSELPFESDRGYSASVRLYRGRRVAYVKGAPERVLAMCSALLTEQGRVAFGEPGADPEDVRRAAEDMAGRGLRVLAMARLELGDEPAPAEVALSGRTLELLGLQGMMDPPRAGVREAVLGCREAGVRVVMITGDHASTARSIGAALGIAAPDGRVVTGPELEVMDDAALTEIARTASVYARVTPEHKLRVVRALQAGGDVVAVTGDGVNDAPALKAAQIGVAMGRGGTDVAREASDMVLADDNFVSIYAAIDEGRVTFENLRKATFFLVSTGAAAIIALLTSLALGWPLPLLPAQLLWLNVVTNGLQDVALAFEPGEPHVLRRPPRSAAEGILSPLLWERTLIASLVMATGTLLLFRWELGQSGDLAQAQTVALTTMVLFQNFHVGNARSEVTSAFRRSLYSNPFLLAAVATALAVHVGALYFGPTQYVLRVVPIAAEAWPRMVLVALSVIAVVELHKWIRRPRR